MLIEHVGDGTTKNYYMVPVVTVDQLANLCGGRGKKRIQDASEYVPCPLTDCNEATVFTKIKTRTMEPLLHLEEGVFIDFTQRTLKDGSTYAVCLKERDNGRKNFRVVFRQAVAHEDHYRLVALNGTTQE